MFRDGKVIRVCVLLRRKAAFWFGVERVTRSLSVSVSTPLANVSVAAGPSQPFLFQA